MKVSEKTIETQILRYLQLKRIFAWKNQSVGVYDAKRGIFRKPRSAYQIKGVSDILGVFNGRLLAIEVKAKGGYPTQEQKDFISNVNAQGGIAFIARSIEDVERELFREGEKDGSS